MCKQDADRENDEHPQADDAESAEFQSEAVAAFVEAVRERIEQARKDKTDFKKADLIEVLAPQLADLDREVSELKGKYSRVARLAHQLTSELSQSKDRLSREQERLPSKAKEDFAKEMLGIVDGVNQAETMLKDADASVREGIRLISISIDHAFESQGFTKISPMLVPFDPAHHESIGNVESAEHPEGTVIELVQSGCRIKSTGKVLRAAKVIVSKKPSVDTDSNGESEPTESDADCPPPTAPTTT